MVLSVVVASTREKRVGLSVGEWMLERVREHGAFSSELIDLKEIDLPLLDEPTHPRLHAYTKQHSKTWSARITASDAFVFVTPEYNFGTAPALVNALDYLYIEWNYKACAFVSYGGVSGGTRGVQMAKQIVTALKMVPIVESVAIPFITKQMIDGRFHAGELQDKAAAIMLDELARWTSALAVLRQA